MGVGTNTADGSQAAHGWYIPADRYQKNCAGSTCTATSVDGGGTDGKACLIAKPKCNKMGGGDATVACAVLGVPANANRNAFQLKFKTTTCKKGTCATDTAQTNDK